MIVIIPGLSTGVLISTVFPGFSLAKETALVSCLGIAISDELLSLKIPLLIIVAFLPFVVGLVCGIGIAFVGSTFPILIPMIHSVGESQFMLAYIMLAMVCGFAGVLLSPLHLCLILSNDYFKTQLTSVYKHLWLPCAALILSAFGYFWLLHWACIQIFS